MDQHKKDLIREFKAKPLTGGICKTTNQKNGRYLLEAVVNPQGSKNRFTFAQMTGTSLGFRLQKDWETFGGDAFTFKILEEITQKETQTEAEFREDLELLGELWAEKFDPDLSY